MSLNNFMDQIKRWLEENQIKNMEEKSMETFIDDHRLQADSNLEQYQKAAAVIAQDFQTKIKQAEADVQDAKKNLKQKKSDLAALQMEYAQASSRSSKKIADLKKMLSESADPKIEEAIHDFIEAGRGIRQIDPAVSCVGRTVDPGSTTVRKKYVSNYPRIVKALDYIRSGLEELRGMKLSPQLDKSRLDDLLSGLPTKRDFGKA